MPEERSEPALRVPEGSSSDDSRTASPFAPEPKPSIGYLLVWATCVAGYLSARETCCRVGGNPILGGVEPGFYSIWAVIAGAYLAGLVLMASRWRHHRRFPQSGGEMLWLMGAVAILQPLIIISGVALASPGTFNVGWYKTSWYFAGLVLWLPLYAYSIRAFSSYWRVYFVFALVLKLSSYLVTFLPFFLFIHGTRRLLEIVLLLLVATLDLRRREGCYPWPHWFGIVLHFVDLIFFVTALVFRHWS